jgi:hypothetical protein
LITSVAGCSLTERRLRRGVVTQASTLTELQYQQVLGNLAMMSLDPDAIPSHINLRDGSAQIQDNGSISTASPATVFPSATGSRTFVAQWSMIPVTDDVELRILRLTYRRALGYDEALDIDLANDLAHELCKRVSNSDFLDVRSDPNVNVEVLKSANLFKELERSRPNEAELSELLKPRTIEPEIRWLRWVNEPLDKPPRGLKNLIIVACSRNLLQIRAFDGAGNMRDTDETKLLGKEAQIDSLKKRLEGLGQPRQLKPEEEMQIKVLLEPLVRDTQLYPNQTNLHETYYKKNVEAFESTLNRLNNLANAVLYYSIGSSDNKLIFENEIHPGFGGKHNLDYIKSWDTMMYVSDEGNGKYNQNSVSPVVRDARRQVKEFYEDLLEISPGWFDVGPKKAVPHDACYVGRYRDQYAWVSARGRKDLADFTIKILNFATLIKDQTITTVPGGPRFTPSIPTR